MPDMIPLDRALGRLKSALDSLDAAVELKLSRQAGQADRDSELAAMQDDRSRLAQDLDAAAAHAARLDAALIEAGARIERASAEIRQVLDARQER